MILDDEGNRDRAATWAAMARANTDWMIETAAHTDYRLTNRVSLSFSAGATGMESEVILVRHSHNVHYQPHELCSVAHIASCSQIDLADYSHTPLLLEDNAWGLPDTLRFHLTADGIERRLKPPNKVIVIA